MMNGRLHYSLKGGLPDLEFICPLLLAAVQDNLSPRRTLPQILSSYHDIYISTDIMEYGITYGFIYPEFSRVGQISFDRSWVIRWVGVSCPLTFMIDGYLLVMPSPD